MSKRLPPPAPRTIIWSDITAERVDDSVRLHIQQTEQVDVELWLPIGAALQAATALFELALGHDRARRVQARLTCAHGVSGDGYCLQCAPIGIPFESAQGHLAADEQTNFDEVIG